MLLFLAGGGCWCYCNLKTMLHPTTRVWIWFSEADMNGNHNQVCHWMGTSAVTPNTTERRCCSSICKIYKRSGCTSMRVYLPSGHQAWHWKILHLLVQNEYHSISNWTLHLQWISNCHILPSCLIPGGHYSNGTFHIPAPAQRYVSPSKKKCFALDLVYYMVGIA